MAQEQRIRLNTIVELVECTLELVKTGLTFKAWHGDDGFYYIDLTGGY